MDTDKLAGWIDRVRQGRLSRRGFVRRLAAFGLTAPMATQILALGGVAMADEVPSYKPTKAGGGGTVKLLWWQGPTLLNPHFAVGTKDQDGSRIFYEPLAAWDSQGNLQPNFGGRNSKPRERRSFGGRKNRHLETQAGVKWHDGAPFSADDVVFNWAYARDPATAAVTAGSYNTVTVEKVDDLTVKVISPKPMVFWADAFVSINGMIIPKHLFEAYSGGKSREAPTNLTPVGTGPYLFKEFRPGDLVSGVINPNYHRPNRPYFDAIEMKGGGDAASAARAVLQTGEYDFAWNLQVEDEVLTKLEAAGKGVVRITEGGQIEHIQVNFTDPNVEIDGERSSLKTKHPTLSDPAVRQALSMLVDKDSVHKYIYGRGGAAARNMVFNPKRFDSPNTHWEFNVDKAIALLEQAGYKPGPDGVRVKDGKALNWVFQTSTNQPRQKTQQIVKQACKKAGINIEIKSVIASVYFSSDVANPDTYPHFYTDIQMYTTGPSRPDHGLFLQLFLGSDVAQKANKWQGRNITRWQNAEYDETYAESEAELDPVKRAALLIHLNDLVINNFVAIPVVTRPNVAAMNKRLVAELSGFDSYIWNLSDWYMEG